MEQVNGDTTLMKYSVFMVHYGYFVGILYMLRLWYQSLWIVDLKSNIKQLLKSNFLISRLAFETLPYGNDILLHMGQYLQNTYNGRRGCK